MSTETGKLADLLQFHPTCAPVSHDLCGLASASASDAYEASLDAAQAPAREAATGGHYTPTCAPLSPEPEATSHDPGATTPPTPAGLEPETLRRVLETLKHAWGGVQAIADEATKLQDENQRLRGVLYGIGRIGTEDGLTADEYQQRLLSAVGRATSAGEAQAVAETSPHMRAAARREPEPSPKQQAKIFDMDTAPLDRSRVYLHFEDGSKSAAYYRSTFQGGPKAWGTGPHFTDKVTRTPIGWSPIHPMAEPRSHMRAAARREPNP